MRRNGCPACWDELFLYEKVGRRAIDHERSRNETGTEILPPYNPSKKMGIQGDASPWQEARRVKAAGFDPWAEPSKSCPLILLGRSVGRLRLFLGGLLGAFGLVPMRRLKRLAGAPKLLERL